MLRCCLIPVRTAKIGSFWETMWKREKWYNAAFFTLWHSVGLCFLLAFVPPSLRSTPVRCKKTAAQKKVASWIHVVWLVSIHLATSCNSTLTQCYELHLRFVCSWELSFISLVILNESRRERWKLPRKWHVERMSTSEDKKMRWNRPDIWLYLWFGKII